MQKQIVAMLSEDIGNNEDWNINCCDFVLIEGEEEELEIFYDMILDNIPDVIAYEREAVKLLQTNYPKFKFTYLGKAGAIEMRFKK